MTDRPLTPLNETEVERSSPERPRTPLIERLSGVPQEETVAGENMSTYKYFPHRESQKFYGLVNVICFLTSYYVVNLRLSYQCFS